MSSPLAFRVAFDFDKAIKTVLASNTGAMSSDELQQRIAQQYMIQTDRSRFAAALRRLESDGVIRHTIAARGWFLR